MSNSTESRNGVLTRRIRIALLACYWLLIFAGTHVPGQLVHGEITNDKLLHFSAFAGLAFLLGWVLAPLRPTRMALLGVLLIASIYAATDEFTQILVPSRTADVWDWFADVLGTVVGLFAYLVSWVFANEFWRSFCRGDSDGAASREVSS